MEVQPRESAIDEGQMNTGAEGDENGFEIQSDTPQPALEASEHTMDMPYTFTHLDELGNWPQRLLHLPTMTSHQWQPGNYFAGIKEPRYRAISYTWGRWRLRDGVEPNIGPALNISGVPWSIPRIKRSHFTEMQLNQAIAALCKYPFEDDDPVEFLWLDLACIDQRWGPMAASEVGRQAAIFEKATSVGIWLSQSGKDKVSLDRLITFFVRLGSLFSSQKSLFKLESPEFRSSLLSGLNEVLCDPWFTSLWTLQEAFLCPRAFFLSSTSEIFLRVNLEERSSQHQVKNLLRKDSDESPVTLGELASQCTSVARAAMPYLGEDDHAKAAIKAFREEMASKSQASGFEAIAYPKGGQMALFSSAQYRTASKDQDHIYGIMQVFRYRLGASRPGCASISYTRSELADQLGSEILKDRPVQSQLHQFTVPAERGKAWRISPSSHVPSDLISLIIQLNEHGCDRTIGSRACHLSTAEVKGNLYGHFAGSTCPFRILCEIWDLLEEGLLEHAKTSPGRGSFSPVANFYPDVSEHVRDSVEYRSRSPMLIPYWDNKRHASFRRYLNEKFKDAQFLVLHLGCCVVIPQYKSHIGLMLLRVKVGDTLYWHRLGFIVWEMRLWEFQTRVPQWNEDLAGQLDGTSGCWKKLSGLFG